MNMNRWFLAFSLLILIGYFPLEGTAEGAAQEANVSWQKVGGGIWDLLGFSKDNKTAYLIRDKVSITLDKPDKTSILGPEESRRKYKLLSVDMASFKITEVFPTKIIETPKYIIIILDDQKFLVEPFLFNFHPTFPSPDKKKVAIAGGPNDWILNKEEIFLLDINTLSEELVNNQEKVGGYGKKELYEFYEKNGTGDYLPIWAFPLGWLSDHEIVYTSERTLDGESLWVIDLNNKTEKLLLKVSDVKKIGEWSIAVKDILPGPRFLFDNSYLGYEVTDLKGKIIYTVPHKSSQPTDLSPDKKRIFSDEGYIFNITTGKKIPLPPLPSSYFSYYWREEGDAFAFFSSPEDYTKVVLAIVGLDEVKGAANLMTIRTDLTKGLFFDRREHTEWRIYWLDKDHLLLTTIRVRPYFDISGKEFISWILTIK